MIHEKTFILSSLFQSSESEAPISAKSSDSEKTVHWTIMEGVIFGSFFLLAAIAFVLNQVKIILVFLCPKYFKFVTSFLTIRVYMLL